MSFIRQTAGLICSGIRSGQYEGCHVEHPGSDEYRDAQKQIARIVANAVAQFLKFDAYNGEDDFAMAAAKAICHDLHEGHWAKNCRLPLGKPMDKARKEIAGLIRRMAGQSLLDGWEGP